MLGANVGTALIVQVLSFNVSAAAPVFLLVGIIGFRRGGRTRTRDLGRVAIGLGLMLLALHILLDTLAPAEEAPQIRELIALFTSQPVICVFLAAVLTWAAHSSVAVVLLVMSLASKGLAYTQISAHLAEVHDTEISPESVARITDLVYWLPMYTFTKNFAFSDTIEFPVSADEYIRLYMVHWR